MTGTGNQVLKSRIISALNSFTSAMIGVAGFLLIFFHISNGETNVVSAGLHTLYTMIPLLIIILGILLLLWNRDKITNDSVKRVLLVLQYIVLRLASGIVNQLQTDPKYWSTICFEAFLLIGINVLTVNIKTIRVVFCELLAFNLITISICLYHYVFLKENMIASLEGFSDQIITNLPFSLIFSNPNIAGMLAGICSSICILLFRDASKLFRVLLIPVIIINIMFMVWSSCRSAMVGSTIILILCIFRWFAKKPNWKSIITFAMMICIGFLIPVYAITLTADRDKQLQNTEYEAVLNDMSSGRYNIWKQHILTQKGHCILGFGTATKAINARSKYLKERDSDKTVEMDETHQIMIERTDLGTHNGYLELILVAGFPAALLIFAFVFISIRSMDNDFIEKHPIILLLVLFFWLCVQESRFITSSVHYIAFLMMLLLNWRENENNEEVT